VNVTKTIYAKKIVEARVMKDPNEAIVFHSVKASGKSGIRRGIPASPRKCIGKKHKFTPMNVVQK
jgi:hypothetical protein